MKAEVGVKAEGVKKVETVEDRREGRMVGTEKGVGKRVEEGMGEGVEWVGGREGVGKETAVWEEGEKEGVGMETEGGVWDWERGERRGACIPPAH